jgi:glutamate dehydrogenase
MLTMCCYDSYANLAKLGTNETNIWEVASDVFLRDKTKLVRERYQQIIKDAVNRLSPVARVFETYRDGTIPLMFAFNHGAGTTTSYMLQLTELLKQGDLVPTRKFIETFANGIIVFSLYLRPLASTDLMKRKVDNLLKQFSMLHLVPKSSYTPAFLAGEYTAEQYTYVSAVSRAIYYFISQRSEEFDVLANHLKNDPLNLGRLRLLHTSLKRESVSQSRISEALRANPQLAALLFQDFHARTTQVGRLPPNEALEKRIKNEATSLLDQQVLLAMCTFNLHVLKTNFYKRKKSALCFRLDPTFLSTKDWPEALFGLFFVMGSDFQGIPHHHLVSLT